MMNSFAKKNVLVALLLLFVSLARAQDIQFSQYYNLVQYQNPAFVGTARGWRALLHSRLQWPGLDARYTTSVAAMDYNLAKYNSGIGAMFISDDQGGASIKSYHGLFQYSYQIKLSPSAMLRAGMSAGFTRRVLNNSDLYYPGQFNGTGFDNSGNVPQYSKNYVDLTAGLLLYTEKFWMGLSSAHLNQPNQSFVGNRELLSRRIDLLLGYKIILQSNATMRYLEKEDEDVWALYPSLLYKWQGKSDQLDVGLFSLYQHVKLGLWYRGLPIKNYETSMLNNEALVALAGFRFQHFALSYSYDFSLSGLHQYSNGAHELNLSYIFPTRKQSGYKYKRLPCPEFYGFKE